METAVGNTTQVSKYISFTVFSTLGQIFFFLPAEKCIHFGTWSSAGILYISVSSPRCFKREYEGQFVYRDLFIQWPRSLRRGSAATRLPGLRIRIPPGEWISVACGCFVLTGRSFYVGLVARPEESCRLWCV
jgi:hypothetical protein